jgi:hypothetical protein
MAISNGEREQNERIEENWAFLQEEMADGYVPSFSEWEDVFEDRDPLEFL